jgi:hypothetical protein
MDDRSKTKHILIFIITIYIVTICFEIFLERWRTQLHEIDAQFDELFTWLGLYLGISRDINFSVFN